MWPAPSPEEPRISPNFTLREFAVSASHPKLVSQVPRELHPNVLALCMWGLEPLHALHNAPVKVLSGYRSAELNDAVDGSPTSQHRKAEASDVTATDVNKLVEDMMELMIQRSVMGLGQVIYYPSRGFLHIALRSARFPFPMMHVHEPQLGLKYALLEKLTLGGVDEMISRAREQTRKGGGR